VATGCGWGWGFGFRFVGLRPAGREYRRWVCASHNFLAPLVRSLFEAFMTSGCLNAHEWMEFARSDLGSLRRCIVARCRRLFERV
jgi:hypothetical protein